jgi:hypothetical protein
MKKTVLLLLLLTFAIQPSFAEVFKWVDEKGSIHFTDDFTQIPDKYRSTMEKRGEKTGVGEEVLPPKTEWSSVPLKQEAVYKDRLGRSEEYWKNLVEEWNGKLKSSQDKVETLRTKYNELTEKFNESKSTFERANLRKARDEIKKEMDLHRSQIEESKSMLEKKIPQEAELYKAKPEWVTH